MLMMWFVVNMIHINHYKLTPSMPGPCRKRKRTSIFSNPSTNLSKNEELNDFDITYSSVRKGKKNTAGKNLLSAPPLPTAHNRFPIHTPPCTPKRSRVSQIDRSRGTKTFIQTSSQTLEFEDNNKVLNLSFNETAV